MDYPRNVKPGGPINHPRMQAEWIGTFPATVTDANFVRVRSAEGGKLCWEIVFTALAHDGKEGFILNVPPNYVWSGKLERVAQLQLCIGHRIIVNVWRRKNFDSYITTLDGDSDRVSI